MHKIFAKPLFLGKKVIFLTQCHSTNDELAALVEDQKIPEGTVVYTDHQLKGRGQRGNAWEAESGQNVLLSVLLKPKKLAVKDQYLLNLISGLALLDLLGDRLEEKTIKLKWPNDVYIGNKKVAGILVESSIKGTTIESSIVGIGLNLNQLRFDVPTATSVALELGSALDRDSFIEDMLKYLERWYLRLMNGNQKQVLAKYHDSLYWRDEVRTFRNNDGVFTGIIRGINERGLLVIEQEEKSCTYDVKEVQFLK